MRNLARLMLISGLVLVGFASVFAQNEKSAKSDSDIALRAVYNKKTDETTVFFSPAKNVKQFDNRVVEQRFPNEGRDARGINPELMAMQIYFKHKGRHLTVPKQIFISFDIFTDNDSRLLYTSDRDFTIKADEWQLKLGKMELTGKGGDTNLADVNGKQFSRLNMEMPIEYADFVRIINAKNVQMRAGGTVFNLSEKYVESLKRTTDKISVRVKSDSD